MIEIILHVSQEWQNGITSNLLHALISEFIKELADELDEERDNISARKVDFLDASGNSPFLFIEVIIPNLEDRIVNTSRAARRLSDTILLFKSQQKYSRDLQHPVRIKVRLEQPSTAYILLTDG